LGGYCLPAVALLGPVQGFGVVGGVEPGRECDGVARDRRGFILTGPDLPAGTGHRWPPGRPPLPLETSLPGVFAAGDVRRGAVNRVASAVGEGAAAIPWCTATCIPPPPPHQPAR
jgi:thioredoxin reductase (NADPH)